MERTLAALADMIPGAKVIGKEQIGIKDIVHDSRQAGKGALFVCFAGAHVDGHSFIPDVARQGAAAVMTTRADVELPAGVSALVVPDMDAALKNIVPFFFDYPSRKMRLIGITGTNGKTTSSYLIRAILRANGYKVGLIGTIQIMIEDEVLPIHNTTPDIIELERTLNLMYEKGMQYVVMEVSSHALDQGRVYGVEFDTAVFTNLTQDHLDYHGTMENYCLAKAKLFDGLSEPGVKSAKCAVVNIDDAAGKTMLSHAKCKHITYSLDDKAANIRAVDVNLRATGASFAIQGSFGRIELPLRITGQFNVYNVLGAVGAALAENVPLKVIEEALPQFPGVPGRFELVDGGQDFGVVVDYAHTPDGLDNVLRAARQVAEKRVIAVFGCGGDRDRTKRPIMGRIAAELADVVVATSDNPRTEDPQAILDEVVAGVREKIGGKRLEVILDRRKAIFTAIGLARTGDMVVIAGKGHENYQILKDKTIHFDDRETAREALMGGSF